MNITRVSTLEIFTRNRERQGISKPEIATILRKRLNWTKLDPDTMDTLNRERYWEVEQYLKKLEQA